MTDFEKGMLDRLDAILAEMKTAREERAAIHEIKEKDRLEARAAALQWAEEQKNLANRRRQRSS